jgi:hypothetical protein
MRGPHPRSSSVSGQSGLSAILESVQYLAEIRNLWYNNRLGRRKRGAGVLVEAELRVVHNRREGMGNFLGESSVTH